MKYYMLCSCLVLCLFLFGVPACQALTPHQVLVIWSEEPTVANASHAVALHYSKSRGIPSANLLAVQAVATESVTESSYFSQIATPIWNYLSTRPHIKCIVLCYGIPSWVSVPASNGRRSVDSYLTLLGNDGSLDAATMRSAKANPYYNSNTDFSTFFSSSANAVRVGSATWKLNYLVTRLDGYSVPTTSVTINNTTYNIPSDIKAMIDRSVAAQPNGCFVVDRSGADPQYIHIQNTLTAAHIGATLH